MPPKPLAGSSEQCGDLSRGAAVLAFPIQAAGAEALKISLALLMPEIWSELPGICLDHMVHDEILMEAPEALAEGRVRAEDPRGTGLATRI